MEKEPVQANLPFSGDFSVGMEVFTIISNHIQKGVVVKVWNQYGGRECDVYFQHMKNKRMYTLPFCRLYKSYETAMKEVKKRIQELQANFENSLTPEEKEKYLEP